MKAMCSFPDIRQFRDVVTALKLRAQYVGKDEHGEPIYDATRKTPSVVFNGTVKLDGTNAAICYDGTDIWCQSRERIITVDDDNHGFARYVQSNEAKVRRLIADLAMTDLAAAPMAPNQILAVYGEFCGKGISKGRAVNQMDKAFVVFGVALCWFTPNPNSATPDLHRTWVPLPLLRHVIEDAGFHTVLVATQYSITLYPDNPADTYDELRRLTDAAVACCPYGAAFGIHGAGEGIVWVGRDAEGLTHMFKTKNEKEAVVKTPKVMPTLEQSTAIATFVEDMVTDARLEQGIRCVFTDKNRVPVIEHIGEFLRWVGLDVNKEGAEMFAQLKALDIPEKQAMNAVFQHARTWYIKQLDACVTKR